jgi:transposase
MHRRRVVGDRITYVGLDVHKEGIVVAVAEGGQRGEVRDYGRIANTPAALDRLIRKLGGEGVGLRFCYEAGPCGYGIQRHLSAHGHDCVVVAPSLIPKRAGDRVQDGPAGCRQSGAAASGGRADRGVGSRCRA